jgi:hypothetical protein
MGNRWSRNKIENWPRPVNRLRASDWPRPAAAAARIPFAALGVTAAAFGVVEAAVVAYLRAGLDPDGSRFPLVQLPPTLLRIEQARELATLVLLGAVAVAAVRGTAARLAAFLVLFGAWDLVYYAALRLMLRWPADVGAWDLLFLLPVRWIGPVYAPLAVAAVMVATGCLALMHEARRGPFRVRLRHGVGAAAGALLILSSFIRPATWGLDAGLPGRYPVERLVAGLVVGVAAFLDAWRANRRTGPTRPPVVEMRLAEAERR